MRALSDVHSLVNALYFLTLTLPTLPLTEHYKGEYLSRIFTSYIRA